MKSLIFGLLVVCSNISFSQFIDGIYITNFSNTKKWIQYEDNVYGISDLAHFDEAFLVLNSSIIFIKYEPNGDDFYNIYSYVVNVLGKEKFNLDYIPMNLASSDHDYNALLEYIKKGTATIYRVWIISDYNLKVSLSWDIKSPFEDNLIITIFEE